MTTVQPMLMDQTFGQARLHAFLATGMYVRSGHSQARVKTIAYTRGRLGCRVVGAFIPRATGQASTHTCVQLSFGLVGGPALGHMRSQGQDHVARVVASFAAGAGWGSGGRRTGPVGWWIQVQVDGQARTHGIPLGFVGGYAGVSYGYRTGMVARVGHFRFQGQASICLSLAILGPAPANAARISLEALTRERLGGHAPNHHCCGHVVLG